MRPMYSLTLALARCFAVSPAGQSWTHRTWKGLSLTHRHLDHSNDINIMIEAMTNGGFKKKGIVFAPSDALQGDPVILKYAREQVDHIEILKEKGSYQGGEHLL